MSQLEVVYGKNRRIRYGVKLRKRTFLRVKHSIRIHDHARVEDRGVRRQRRRSFQDIRERQVIEPDERQPVFEPLEVANQFLTPELSDCESPITTKTVVVSGRTSSMLSIIGGRSSSRATLVSLRMGLGSLMKRASATWMIGVVGNSCSPYFWTNSG